jgi:DeoR family fructose operon transcriptional repressor
LRENRLKRILDTLAREESVRVPGLAEALGVSAMTIRRDLEVLEGQGYLIRKHGGAVRSEAIERLFSFERRLERGREQKEAICRAAARFIADGDVLFIDCGTTLFRLARYLRERRSLRVITNSLPVVSELIHHGHIRVSLIGGEVVGDRQAAYGSAAERMIGEVHAGKAFIGADGLSLRGGLSSYDEKEAGVTLKMAQNADAVFLLCDSSKIETDSYYRFAPLSLVDMLITDDRLDPQVRERYGREGVRIVTAA